MKSISGLNDAQLKRWLRAGEPLAKSDGDGLTVTISGAGMPPGYFASGTGGEGTSSRWAGIRT